MGEQRAAMRIAVLLVTLSGCSADSGLFSKSPDANAKSDLGLNLFAANPSKLRALQGADLIGPDGRCAADAAPSALNFQAGPEASPQGRPSSAPPEPHTPAARGIGLEMTECEVERIAGYTDKFEITNDERGQRRVTLTYLQGERAGIYRFEGGRLKSIERSPDAPAETPTKPARKTAKKPATGN